MEVNVETLHIVYTLYAHEHIHHMHTHEAQYSTHMHMKHTHYKEVNWLKFPVFGGRNVKIPCISTMAMQSYTVFMKHTHTRVTQNDHISK